MGLSNVSNIPVQHAPESFMTNFKAITDDLPADLSLPLRDRNDDATGTFKNLRETNAHHEFFGQGLDSFGEQPNSEKPIINQQAMFEVNYSSPSNHPVFRNLDEFHVPAPKRTFGFHA